MADKRQFWSYDLYNTETEQTEATENLTADEMSRRNKILRKNGEPQRWVSTPWVNYAPVRLPNREWVLAEIEVSKERAPRWLRVVPGAYADDLLVRRSAAAKAVLGRMLVFSYKYEEVAR